MRNTWKLIAASGLAILLAGGVGCKSSGGPGNVMLSGAGSTFVFPIMQRWIQGFSRTHKNVEVNYQPIGSGGGIEQVKAGTVDFGGSDTPLTDQQFKTMRPVIEIPESAGPVCITYNLPGLKQPLKLSPETLAGIFLGTIKNWQDPAVVKDNPGVALPKESVIVTHRADGSGTTNIFTTYLAAVSPSWQTKVGKGNSVNWPVGLGGKGSAGVTGQIRQSPGTIGYVELTFAQENHLPVALIENQAGKYVAPSTSSTTAAINAFTAELTKDPRTPIVDPPASAPQAYPISGLTFLIIPKDGPDKIKRAALKQFVQYVVTEGQAMAGKLNYAPLPDAVKQYDEQQIATLTAGGQPIR